MGTREGRLGGGLGGGFGHAAAGGGGGDAMKVGLELLDEMVRSNVEVDVYTLASFVNTAKQAYFLKSMLYRNVTKVNLLGH